MGEATTKRGPTSSAPLIILGSARSAGNTRAAVDLVKAQGVNADLVDLRLTNLTPYSYDVQPDDGLVEEIVDKITSAPWVIFASPVYWDSISSDMKTLIERLNVLQTTRCESACRLNGKPCYVLATGFNAELNDHFLAPFRSLLAFFGMQLEGAYYCRFVDGRMLSPLSVISSLANAVRRSPAMCSIPVQPLT